MSRKRQHIDAIATMHEVSELGRGITRKHEALVMADIMGRLEQKPAPALSVLFLLRTGSLDKVQEPLPTDTAADPEQVPNSCDKFRLLPQDMQRAILHAIEPGLAEHVAKLKPKAMRDLLCFALDVQPSSSVFSYNKRSLLAHCELTYRRNGHRLRDAKWKDSAPDWTSMGYFSFVPAEGPGAIRKVIKHVSGAECELPEGLQEQRLFIKNNHSHANAKLVSDAVSVVILSLFQKARLYVKAPTCLLAVPACSAPPSSPATSAPLTPASQASRGGSSPADFRHETEAASAKVPELP